MADDRVWFVLMHTAGPAVPQGESVFDQPGIAEHYAFLRRRAEAGQLVATGPPRRARSGDDGPGRRAARDGRRQGIGTGLLNVIVHPWRVVTTRL